jgi:hypothetical protein
LLSRRNTQKIAAPGISPKAAPFKLSTDQPGRKGLAANIRPALPVYATARLSLRWYAQLSVLQA